MKKDWNEIGEEGLDDELFRQIDCSWNKKDLIIHLIENLTREEKIDWVNQWYEGEIEEDEIGGKPK